MKILLYRSLEKKNRQGTSITNKKKTRLCNVDANKMLNQLPVSFLLPAIG